MTKFDDQLHCRPLATVGSTAPPQLGHCFRPVVVGETPVYLGDVLALNGDTMFFVHRRVAACDLLPWLIRVLFMTSLEPFLFVLLFGFDDPPRSHACHDFLG